MYARYTLTAGLSVAALVAAVLVQPLVPRAGAAVADADPVVVAVVDPVPEPARRDVDVAIVLDTSGSMEALIDSARARLWDVVNEVAEREPDARLRVALVTFGSPGDAGSGFVVVQQDLTEDLDAVYARAFELSTVGGTENVGWALQTTLEQLAWSSQDGAAQIVFVAGNESADQGRSTHDFRTAGAEARARGIVVNALYAGRHDQGVREHWLRVAEAGGGRYSSIDMQEGTRQQAAPQDRALHELNARLNSTYVPFGSAGVQAAERQKAQDRNAAKLGTSSLASRALTKAGKLYDAAGWDLVDAKNKKKVDLASVPEAALPAPMKGMSVEEKEAYVDEMARERAQVAAEIEALGKQRKEWLDDQRGADEPDGLDEAIGGALAEQL